MFIGFGLAAFFSLLLYSIVLPQIANGMGREPSVVDAWKNPLWTITEMVNGIQLGFGSSAALLGALIVFGAGIWSYARTKPVILGFLFIPALLCAATVIALAHHLWPRFFFFEIGFAALVGIRGAVVLGEGGSKKILNLDNRRAGWVGSAFGIVVVLAAAISTPLVYSPKQDYVSAMNYVQAQAQPGDIIATGGLAVFPYTEYYRVKWTVVNDAPALQNLESQANRTWFVYTFPTVLESEWPDLNGLVRRDFHVVKVFYGSVGDGELIVSRYDRAASNR